MFRRTKYISEEKYGIFIEYLNRTSSIQEIPAKYSISVYGFYQWRYSYEINGIDDLKESMAYKRYSKKLRKQIILEYLSGKYSLGELVKKYRLADKSVLKKGLNNYKNHREVASTPKGMRKSMTKAKAHL